MVVWDKEDAEQGKIVLIIIRSMKFPMNYYYYFFFIQSPCLYIFGFIISSHHHLQLAFSHCQKKALAWAEKNMVRDWEKTNYTIIIAISTQLLFFLLLLLLDDSYLCPSLISGSWYLTLSSSSKLSIKLS